MSLIKENEAGKRSNIVSRLIGIILLGMAVILLFVSTQSGIAGLTYYPAFFIDVPSAIFIVIIAAGTVLISNLRDKQEILRLLSKIVVPIGAIVFIASMIIVRGMNVEPSMIGPNLAVAILPLLYSLIAKVAIEALITKKSN